MLLSPQAEEPASAFQGNRYLSLVAHEWSYGAENPQPQWQMKDCLPVIRPVTSHISHTIPSNSGGGGRFSTNARKSRNLRKSLRRRSESNR